MTNAPLRVDLLELLTRSGGAARSSALRAQGVTDHAMRRAVHRGDVLRVRRSWLVLPSAGADVHAAARVGGRVTCVSAAARRGIWAPRHAETHLAVPRSASRLEVDGIRLHWAAGPAPSPMGGILDPLLNVLFHVARCLPPRDALAVWESAVRTGEADAAVLRRVHWRSTAARRLAEVVSTLSDSGIETAFVALMRSIGVDVRQQVWIDGHPLDGVIGERLLIQIDGFAYHQAADRRRDLRADARLVLRGYTVLRFDYVQVMLAPDEVIATVTEAMAQGLHRA